MLDRLASAIVLTALAGAVQGRSAASVPAPAINEIRQIPVRSGAYVIAHRAPDGRDGLIVEAAQSDCGRRALPCRSPPP